MNASDIVRLLNTDHYAPADLDEVNNICRNYPEFGIAQMLKVRIMEVLGHEKDKELKVAAVYAMDRKKLYQLVNEVHEAIEKKAERETESPSGFTYEPSGGIEFSDEPHAQADVIIEQHAPYAGQEQSEDLLELDEESNEATMEIVEDGAQVEEEAKVGDVAQFEEEAQVEEEARVGEDAQVEEELTSENLITAMVKEESEMEEPGSESQEIPIPEVDEAQQKEQQDEMQDAQQDEPEETQQDEQKDAQQDEQEKPVLEEKAKPGRNNNLIQSFINDDPGVIRADKQTQLKGDVSLNSIKEHDGFITDTLAKIYVKQGLYAKAIYAYEKLSLKYPEKSAYFAAQIEKIRNINHS